MTGTVLCIAILCMNVAWRLAAASCDPCICTGGSAVCDQPGMLSVFPTELPRQTESIVFVLQQFNDTLLRPSHLRHYAEHLRKLTIRECSLRTVVPGAFEMLSRLEDIDLTGNNITEIQSDTFDGLSLKSVKLDMNEGIRLWSTSFRGATIQTLSLIGCKLKEVTPSLFQPLLPGLTHLLLGKNFLRQLPSKFQDIANHLQNLDVSDNPLNCTCELQWLSSYLSSVRHSRAIQEQVNRTVCQSPPTLFAVPVIALLSQRLLSCYPLSIQRVDVYFINEHTWEIKCRVQGPTSATQLHWVRPGPSLDTTETLTDNVERLSDNLLQSSITVRQGRSPSVYTCAALDGDSTTSLDIRISWPGALLGSGQGKKDLSSAMYVPADLRSSSRHYFLRPRHSLLELFGTIFLTFLTTVLLFILLYRFTCCCLKGQTLQTYHNSLSSTSHAGGVNGGMAGLDYYPTAQNTNHNVKKPLPGYPHLSVYDGCSLDSSQVYDVPSNNNFLLQQQQQQQNNSLTYNGHLHGAMVTTPFLLPQPAQVPPTPTVQHPSHMEARGAYINPSEQQSFIDFKTQQQLH